MIFNLANLVESLDVTLVSDPERNLRSELNVDCSTVGVMQLQASKPYHDKKQCLNNDRYATWNKNLDNCQGIS